VIATKFGFKAAAAGALGAEQCMGGKKNRQSAGVRQGLSPPKAPLHDS